MSTSAQSGSIGFSRTLGFLDALAIGLSVAWSLTAFVIGPDIVDLLGRETPLVFFVGAAFFVIVSLSLLALASETPGNADFYDLARRRGSARLAYVCGWLILGSYIALGLMLAGAVGDRIALFLGFLLDLSVNVDWLIAGVIVLTLIFTLISNLDWTKGRTWFVLASAVVPLVIVVLAFFTLARGATAPPIELKPLRHWLLPVALLASALWAIDPLLAHRGRLRRPNRTSIAAVSVMWTVIFVFFTVIVLLVLIRPDLEMSNWEDQLTWSENRIELLALLSGIAVCWIGLSRVAASAVALSGEMARDGFLPRRLAGPDSGPSASVLAKVLIHGILGAAVAAHLSDITSASVAAVCLATVTTLLLLPDTLKSESALPDNRRIRFPLHPLLPGLTIAGLAFLALLVLKLAVVPLAGWVVAGLLLFLFYGRKGRIQARKRDLVVTEAELAVSKTRFAVLVAGGDRLPTIDRIRTARALARVRQGEVLVVRVAPMGDPISLDERQNTAKRELEELAELVETVRSTEPDDVPDVETSPLVRIAPTVAGGVLATASELDANLILVGWPGDLDDPTREVDENIADRVFTATGRPVAILQGRPPEVIERIVVATGGGPHAPLALELGACLAEALHVDAELVHVVEKGRKKESSEEILRQTHNRAASPEGVKFSTIGAETLEEGLAEAAGEGVVLILGASVDRLLMQTYFGGLAVKVAEGRDWATLLVKRSERATLYWVRRFWEMLSHPLPTVSMRDRTEVFVEMRHAARGDVDFYVLTFVASTISILGLLLDSGAVIIGAMLVAPLMSPILSIAHGMVQGNTYMIRRGVASTFKGAALAVAVGTVVTLIQPRAIATAQILARTEPNLLDLGVALAAGAAGAYAMARKSVAAAVPGVAISVALVPPLSVVGFGLGSSDFLIAGGALVLFLTNLAGIVLVGALIFLLLGFRPSRAARDEHARRAMAIAVVAILVLAIPLGLQTRRQIHEYRLKAEIAQVFRRDLVRDTVQITNLRIRRQSGSYVAKAVLFVFEDLEPDSLDRLKQHLEEEVGVPVEIDATVLRADSWSTNQPEEVAP